MLNFESLMGKELAIPQRVKLVEGSNYFLDLILDNDKERVYTVHHKLRNYERLARLYAIANDETNVIKNLFLAEQCADISDQKHVKGEIKSILANLI